jgi:hypothetical protein
LATVTHAGAQGNSGGAAALVRLGFAVVRLDAITKRPGDLDWPNPLRRSPIRRGDNYGAVTGPQSHFNRPGHALATLDLDSLRAVAVAPRYLPATALKDGRPGKPLSHWHFLTPLASIPEWALTPGCRSAEVARELYGHVGPFTKSFRDRRTHQEAFKLCGTGAQVVVPDSLWRSADGTRTERRFWDGGRPGEPAVVEFLVLWHALLDLADAIGATVSGIGRSAAKPRAEKSDHSDLTSPPALPLTDAVLERAAAHVARMEPAVATQNGHGRTFRAACALAEGFGLDESTTFALLRDHFNKRCQPPWSAAELRHKARDAVNRADPHVRGYLRDTAPPPVRVYRRPGGRLCSSVEVHL